MIYRSFVIEDRNRCYMGDKNEQHRKPTLTVRGTRRDAMQEADPSGRRTNMERRARVEGAREGVAMLKDVRKGERSEGTRYW